VWRRLSWFFFFFFALKLHLTLPFFSLLCIILYFVFSFFGSALHFTSFFLLFFCSALHFTSSFLFFFVCRYTLLRSSCCFFALHYTLLRLSCFFFVCRYTLLCSSCCFFALHYTLLPLFFFLFVPYFVSRFLFNKNFVCCDVIRREGDARSKKLLGYFFLLFKVEQQFFFIFTFFYNILESFFNSSFRSKQNFCRCSENLGGTLNLSIATRKCARCMFIFSYFVCKLLLIWVLFDLGLDPEVFPVFQNNEWKIPERILKFTLLVNVL
jgi:hypothetical protein